ELALDALAQGLSNTVDIEHREHYFTVNFDPQRTPDELLIVGAGHIALPLAQVGALLGFQVTVLDDREEMATTERFPDAARVLRVDFSAQFRDLAIGPRTYVVRVTRGHK